MCVHVLVCVKMSLYLCVYMYDIKRNTFHGTGAPFPFHGDLLVEIQVVLFAWNFTYVLGWAVIVRVEFHVWIHGVERSMDALNNSTCGSMELNVQWTHYTARPRTQAVLVFMDNALLLFAAGLRVLLRAYKP